MRSIAPGEWPEDPPANRAALDAAQAHYEESQIDGNASVARFLSLTEVAERLGMAGVKSMSKTKLPPPDALIGKTKGWLPSTIDEWNATRPGRGWWRV